jgi:DNA-binding GntR family transcriptional regulator
VSFVTESHSIGKAARRGLGDEVADRIREAIFAGQFAPGAPVREVELAEALEVSRGSVREGLAQLTREGLLHSEWHRGTRVIDLTLADVAEVYSVRAALERLATCAAAEHADEAVHQHLDDLVTAMGTGLNAGSPGHKLLALDIEFHDVIYAAAANRRLVEAWHALRSQVYLFQLARIRLDDADYRKRLVTEHWKLAALIRKRNTKVLATIAEDHVHDARISLMSSLTMR